MGRAAHVGTRMTVPLPGVFDALRRPEYTGENRCVPCTAVNLVIAAALASLLAVAGLRYDPALGLLLGAGSFAAFAATVYLRGYLVPGTPRLTRTYFPDWLLRAFEKEPAVRLGPDDELDVETTLSRLGVVTDCEDVDDVCLTDAFREEWRERIAALRERDTTREELASLLGLSSEELSFTTHGGAFVARLDGRRIGQWESRAAFLADIAAETALQARDGGWTRLDVRQRSQLLGGLRVFLERCPACDGPVAIGEEVVESCCRSMDVVAVTCDDCGARLLESELAA